MMFKHKHGSHNGHFSGNSTESYDHMVVKDDVPLLENSFDSFLMTSYTGNKHIIENRTPSMGEIGTLFR
jgi:hypothetical protein